MSDNQTLSPTTLKQERNAFRFSLAMASIMTFFSVVLLIAGGPPKGFLDLTSLAILVAVASWISTWLSRRGQHIVGVLLLISSLLLACIVTVILYSGFGPVLAIVALMISFGAGSASLPRKYATVVNIVSIALALGFILLDILEPFPREPNGEPAMTWIMAGVLGVVFGVGILRNFGSYNFRTKLIISFIFMSVVTLGILAVFNQITTTNILTENLGRELNGVAESRGNRIGDLLNEQINALTVMALNEVIQEDIYTSNELYTGDQNSILAEIEQLDQQWRAADAADNNNEALVKDRLTNQTARELRAFQNAFPNNAEIFATDIYGAVTGSTARTSDYYQADEEWWQAAYNQGAGDIYISVPEFDDSVGKVSLQIAIPIVGKETNRIVGVLRTTYLLSSLTTILDESFGETGETDLYFPGDFPVNYPQFVDQGSIEPVPNATYEQILETFDKPYLEMYFEGANSIVSQAPVTSLQGNPAVDNLGWFIVVYQNSDEVLQPVGVQTRTTLVLVIVIVSIAALIAMGLAQVLVAPISRLISTAQGIAAGDLTIQAEVTTEDEVGVLATAFNEMTGQLRNLLANLEDRIAARTRDLELAGEVSRGLSLVSETETMLSQAVDVIRERFDLYYTQVYLTNPAGRSLILRAGTGEVGQTLLRRGHRLALDLGSLNGIAATERRTVIVTDTETSTIHRPNPLLPDTRSEMAVPLLVGDRVVGVLDMQSTQPGALSEENQAAFEALAGSLAITIVNAALFEQAESARSTVENQARRLTSSGWQDFLDAIERTEQFAYTYDRESVSHLSEAIPDTVETSLTAPIQVTGTIVGKLQFLRERAWTQDDQTIIQSVSRQVAQQIENLRLLAQAEQYQAASQEALRQLTREGWEQYQTTLQDSQIGFLYSDFEVKPWSEIESEKALSYPINVQNEVIGYLNILGAETISEEDTELVAYVNEQLSTHLENIRLSQQTLNALSQTELMYDIGRQLNLATNEDEILAALSDTALRVDCKQSALMYIDLDSTGSPEWLQIVAAWSQQKNTQNSPVGTRFPAAHFPLMSVLMTTPEKPILIPNVAQDQQIDDGLRNRWLSTGIQAMCIIPLAQAGHWLGLITFSWSEVHEFSYLEENIFDSLVSLATPVVQSQRLFDQAQTRAEREQTLRQITTQVRTFVEPDMILRTAARELGDKLGRKVIIQMGKTQPDPQIPDDDSLDKAATS